MDNQIANTYLRHMPIRVASINRSFPAPSEYDDLDTQAHDTITTKLLGLAHWFEKPAVQAEGTHFTAYADVNGFLPGHIHMDCLKSWAWQHIFYDRDTDLAVPQDRLPSSICEDFVASCYGGVHRMLEVDPISASAVVDLFFPRTRGEIPYVRRVSEFPGETLESWRGVTGVRQAAILLSKALLRLEF